MELNFDENQRFSLKEIILGENTSRILSVFIFIILTILSLSVLPNNQKEEVNLTGVFHGIIGDVLNNPDYSFTVTSLEKNENFQIEIDFFDIEETATLPSLFLICTGDPSQQASKIGNTFDSGTRIIETSYKVDFANFPNPCKNPLFLRVEDVRTGEFKWVRFI